MAITIASIDSYLKREIEPRLRTVLENCYIIDEVLKDFDPQSRNSFKESFCGKDASHEVTVGFDFPQYKTSHQAHYLIQLGEGRETQNSLGNVQGIFLEQDEDTHKELSVAQREGDTLVFYVENTVGELLHIEDISFSKSDNLKIEDNSIRFRYKGNESLEGYNGVVVYTKKKSDSKGIVKGFTSEETCMVVGLSHNVDIARCLDALLKMILISMRDNLEEQNRFQLQSLDFGTMSPIIEQGESMIFGRPTTIKYTASHDLDYHVAEEINKVTIQERVESDEQEDENNTN